MDAVSPADAMLDAIGDAEIAEDTRSGDGSRSEGGVLGGVGLVVMDRRVLLAKVRKGTATAGRGTGSCGLCMMCQCAVPIYYTRVDY